MDIVANGDTGCEKEPLATITRLTAAMANAAKGRESIMIRHSFKGAIGQIITLENQSRKSKQLES
ncbi:hypothetical protein [Agrobacterium sp. CGMCC 11546]|uniref:hypothetical protein n=1 Tax=Agrobacterium sp. CGMCC 11546 TaxID=2579248 RepID=UPI000556C1E8|nr:hypothetical protein [Agrobacterium sp. CGMCC 11546]